MQQGFAWITVHGLDLILVHAMLVSDLKCTEQVISIAQWLACLSLFSCSAAKAGTRWPVYCWAIQTIQSPLHCWHIPCQQHHMVKTARWSPNNKLENKLLLWINHLGLQEHSWSGNGMVYFLFKQARTTLDRMLIWNSEWSHHHMLVLPFVQQETHTHQWMLMLASPSLVSACNYDSAVYCAIKACTTTIFFAAANLTAVPRVQLRFRLTLRFFSNVPLLIQEVIQFLYNNIYLYL